MGTPSVHGCSGAESRIPLTIVREPCFIRPYQSTMIFRITECTDDLMLVSPTGSGKTTICLASCATLFARKAIRGAVIATPLRNVNDGFRRTVARTSYFQHSTPTGMGAQRIPASKVLVRIAGGSGSSTADLTSYLSNCMLKHAETALVVAHATLTHDNVQLPDRLDGTLLFVDEAHKFEDGNRLAKFAEAWKARGGRVIFTTATDYRPNGEPVRMDGMAVHRRPVGLHIEEGFAPSRLEVETVRVEAQFDTYTKAEAFGEKDLSTDRAQRIADAMVTRALHDRRDGKTPKIVIRIGNQKGGCENVVRIVCEAFKAAGFRVFDATGVGDLKAKALNDMLDREDSKAHVAYDNAQYDVIVGIQRVTVGMDWVKCSDVYSFGLIGSLPLVVQLFGRSWRKKDANHPFADRAKLTMFVPVPEGDTDIIEKIGTRHSKDALIVLAHLSGLVSGRGKVRKAVLAAVEDDVRAKGGTEIDVIRAVEEVDAVLHTNDPRESAEARLAITAVLERDNNEVTSLLDEMLRAQPSIDGQPDPVGITLIDMVAGGNDDVADQMRRSVSKYLSRGLKTPEAIRRAVETTLPQFQGETLETVAVSDTLNALVHGLTGNRLGTYGSLIAALCAIPYVDLRDRVRAMGIQTRAEYGHRHVEIEGAPEDPARVYVDEFTGWSDFLGHTVRVLTIEELREECVVRGIKTRTVYAERWSEIPGAPRDPRLFFTKAGVDFDYSMIFDGWVGRPGSGKPLTEDMILKGLDKCYKQTGMYPTERGVKGDPSVGLPEGESWNAVNLALSKGGRGWERADSLARFRHRHGRVTPAERAKSAAQTKARRKVR